MRNIQEVHLVEASLRYTGEIGKQQVDVDGQQGRLPAHDDAVTSLAGSRWTWTGSHSTANMTTTSTSVLLIHGLGWDGSGSELSMDRFDTCVGLSWVRCSKSTKNLKRLWV